MYLELIIPEVKLENFIKENKNIEGEYELYKRKYNAIKRFIKCKYGCFQRSL